MMKLSFSKNRINLIHSFGISRSSNDYYDIIYIYYNGWRFHWKRRSAPSKRYGESSELILSVLESGIQVPENYQSREHLWDF